MLCLEKKKKKIQPPHHHQNSPSLWAIHRYRHDHQQNRGQINPKDTFHPRPLFPQAVHFQKCTGPLHKGAIQTSSVIGNTELLFVGISFFFLSFFLLKGKPLFLQFCIYFCLLLPTQRRLPSINLSIPLNYLNSNMQRVTQACGQNLWLQDLALSCGWDDVLTHACMHTHTYTSVMSLTARK